MRDAPDPTPTSRCPAPNERMLLVGRGTPASRARKQHSSVANQGRVGGLPDAAGRRGTAGWQRAVDPPAPAAGPARARPLDRRRRGGPRRASRATGATHPLGVRRPHPALRCRRSGLRPPVDARAPRSAGLVGPCLGGRPDAGAGANEGHAGRYPAARSCGAGVQSFVLVERARPAGRHRGRAGRHWHQRPRAPRGCRREPRDRGGDHRDLRRCPHRLAPARRRRAAPLARHRRRGHQGGCDPAGGRCRRRGVRHRAARLGPGRPGRAARRRSRGGRRPRRCGAAGRAVAPSPRPRAGRRALRPHPGDRKGRDPQRICTTPCCRRWR